MRALWVSVLINAVAAQSAVAVEVPAGTEVVWVGEQITHNGFPMDIQSFSSGLTVESMLEYYRGQWAGLGSDDIPGYVENDVGEWKTISRLEGDTNTVIQVKASEKYGSEGFISVMKLIDAPSTSQISRDMPRMSGTSTLSTTDSQDKSLRASTMILQNDYGVAENARFYKEQMTSLGWQLARDFEHDEKHILFFNRKDAKLEIAISNAKDGTLIFANVAY